MIFLGLKYGDWTILEDKGTKNSEKAKIFKRTYHYVIAICKCGNKKEVLLAALINGKSKHCRSCHTISINLIHGMAHTVEYQAWHDMKRRCYNIYAKNYKNYGGRGITVCDRWTDKENGFMNFWEDMGKRTSSNHSLDRKNNNGDYTPDNCNWSDYLTQQRNKRTNHKLTHNSNILTIREWSELTGTNSGTIRSRLRQKWDIEEALYGKQKRRENSL